MHYFQIIVQTFPQKNMDAFFYNELEIKRFHLEIWKANKYLNPNLVP